VFKCLGEIHAHPHDLKQLMVTVTDPQVNSSVDTRGQVAQAVGEISAGKAEKV